LVTRAEDILEEIHHIPRPAIPEAPAQPKLPEVEARVYQTLEQGALHIDQIIASTAWPSSKVSAILLSLELGGHVKQLPGMRFARK
jgi:DNA processing protein